ncbi:hypothetical protein SAY87_026158 [Trapa incisa]|uniref:VQ domain-containing protein n=1 Tax=Trapa incisa TaxID=236973 RepID=A0AAN7GMM8_9MYRT|nr:hypothetical protein SAY87_026158 [Trapa incisa]
MDCGNSSGSMQSSSGGDEEYDSRVEPISSFLNINPSPSGHLSGGGSFPGLSSHHHHHQLLHPLPMTALHSTTSPVYDPLSNFFDPHPVTARSAAPVTLASSPAILNLDMAAWSKDPTLGLPPLHPLHGHTDQVQGRGVGGSFPEREGLRQLGSISESAPNEPTTATNTTTATNGGSTSSNLSARNPKKRSRASRRAPTTVLNTDTTNFRAMVQEFTGIPAPPFAAPPFQRNRLDIFGSPSYLLRPFFHKIQHPPPAAVPPSFATTPPLASSASSSSPFHTDLGLLRPPSFLNQTTPVLDFQSLFRAPGQKYPIAGSSMFPAKTLGPADIPESGDHGSRLKIGLVEEFGLSHGQVSTQLQAGLLDVASSDRTPSENNNNSDSNNNHHSHPPQNWHGDGTSSGGGSSRQGMLRPIGGNLDRANINVDRGQSRGGGSSRGEGMVESWICSSD